MNDQTSDPNNGNGTRIPFFSVIVTTFNREVLLKRALDSLLAQTEKDWEAVIIDDGSTDHTSSQVSPFLKKYCNITYLQRVHGGESWAKNEGLKASKGRFVTFLDSDDEYHPEHLASRKKILLLHPEIHFLHGGVNILGNIFVPDRFDMSKMINLHDCVIGGSFFIERQTLLALKGFKEIKLGPDADLYDRAREAGVMMMDTTLPTYIHHHDTPDSITLQLLYEEKRAISSHISGLKGLL